MDPIEQKHRHPMRAAMDALKEVFPGMGITLMVFDYGDMGRMNYISTAKREDMLKAIALHRLVPTIEIAPQRFDKADEVIRALTKSSHFGKICMQSWDS